MGFSAADVKELRELTGCGMMDCKNALKDADGDMEKATVILREKGLAASKKKEGRVTAEGLVYAEVNEKSGAIIEVNSETDFVAKNESFREFVKNCCCVVLEKSPADVAALLQCDMDGETVEAALQQKVLTIKENLKIRRFARFDGHCVAYIHGGGTHAVLVNFDTDDATAAKPEFVTMGKDVAMQIAAANPAYVAREEVPQSVLDSEKEILRQQAMNDGKPEAIAQKMVVGRISKYYKENCLLDQEFVKDPEQTVGQYVASASKAFGGNVKVVSFVRYEAGEGIEKRQDDFAAEVASLQN